MFSELFQLPVCSQKSFKVAINTIANCYGLNYAPQPTTKFMYQSFTFFYPSKFLFSSVQFSRSVVFDSLRPHGLHAAHQASLFFTISWSMPKLMSVESVMPSNHLIFCRPHLLLPSIFPSIRVFSNESTLRIRWPKNKDMHIQYSSSKINDTGSLLSKPLHCFRTLHTAVLTGGLY